VEVQLGLRAPRSSESQLRNPLRNFAAYGSVPIFNLEITPDGALSDKSTEALSAAR